PAESLRRGESTEGRSSVRRLGSAAYGDQCPHAERLVAGQRAVELPRPGTALQVLASPGPGPRAREVESAERGVRSVHPQRPRGVWNDRGGGEAEPLLEVRGVRGAEVGGGPEVVGRVEGREPRERADHLPSRLRADDERGPTGAVIGPRAVLLGAPAELRPEG